MTYTNLCAHNIIVMTHPCRPAALVMAAAAVTSYRYSQKDSRRKREREKEFAYVVCRRVKNV